MLPTVLTVLITHPAVIRGDQRTDLHNTIVKMLDSLGPEWEHAITTCGEGNLLVKFTRRHYMGKIMSEVLPPMMPA
jgi:hypothetical protein